MSQVLDFRSAGWSHRRARRVDNPVRSLPGDAGEVNPDNTPGRVLYEMFAVLVSAALVAGALTWLAPAALS